MKKETGQTPARPTGRGGGAVVLNMMRRHRLVDEDGMSPMMMDSHFSSSPLLQKITIAWMLRLWTMKYKLTKVFTSLKMSDLRTVCGCFAYNFA